ncbi:hypothetical protein A3J56_02015 [Candidatus Giovannonibacteria bacterium RIFCSPHIGHO2_02_FULL_46_20]|uniref:Uncharacterized protein n=1 Tax=Candidatus Giovannonibacteria bacterium RIFCSPHIGHO2_02_FULL_46_20 TaxID=1798338 RepID=A0A1F5WGE7_9BACT|nr:MAG: hypothetical protein A3J56_02015 [Candidatus Giovannonibacteria bacterium RIFCSPHIGHO2_02_FULL_46_20]
MIEYIKKAIADGKTFIVFAVLRVIGQVLFFLTPLLIAFYFSQENFGVYSLSITTVYLFTTLLIGSSQKPFIVYANQERNESGSIRKSFTARLLFFVAASFLFALLVFFFKDNIMRFTYLPSSAFVYLALAYIGISIRYVFEALFLGLGKKIAYAIFSGVTGFISLLFLGIFFIVHIPTLEAALAAFFVGPFIAGICSLFFIRSKDIFPLAYDAEMCKKMFRYTRWAFLGGGAMYLVNWGDNFVLRYIVPLEEIGEYNFGYQFFKGTVILLGTINLYFLPFLSLHARDTEKIRAYMYRKRPLIFFLGAASIAAFFFVFPFVIQMVYGEKYADAIPVVRVLSVGSLFLLWSVFYAALFDALEYYRFTQVAHVAMVAINLILDVVFVTWWGIIGAAIATTIAYFFSALLYEWYFQAHYRRRA